MGRPVAVDLFCGLGGWTEGLLAEGWHCRGYDIEAHEYGDERYPGELVLADVATLTGADVADADLIVASPPCQEFSYMAMPWSRAKQIARALRGEDAFPDGYRGSRTIAELRALFDACFRIQREANEIRQAKGLPPIPMVVENVRGCEAWVGRAAYNYGSFYLWGDVPALMPSTAKAVKVPALDGGRRTDPGKGARFTSRDCGDEGRKNPGFRFDGSGRSFQSESVERHVAEGRKGAGGSWVGQGYQPHQHGRNTSSGSKARKAASAKIAKIPFAISSWVARCYLPERTAAA